MKQLSLFYETGRQQLLNDLFVAYFDARRNKRNTVNALSFELNYEHNLIKLADEMINFNYKIRPSLCFISFKPVQREIFAGDFRDRIVHHLIYNYIAPLFERTFINDSYSCRKKKGTHYGINRINHFIRSCSKNYHCDCFILKLDIHGYFMSIDRFILYDKIKKYLCKRRNLLGFDLTMVLYLIKKVIFNNPTSDCILKGKKTDWNGLPASKSLFHSDKNKGLPIGNLTSQLFANIYLNEFDHMVKKGMKIKYYGRYVDDFILIHSNCEYLKGLIPQIREYLSSHLLLTLHPDKIYLQHYSKGVKFLGAIIKPFRMYITSRTKNNLYQNIGLWNSIIKKQNYRLYREQINAYLASINSYMGIMIHFSTYNLRRKMLNERVSNEFYKYFSISDSFKKLKKKVSFRTVPLLSDKPPVCVSDEFELNSGIRINQN